MNNEIIIRNLDPQEITINEGGTITGITNVYVNGTDVTIGTKAYVIVPTKLSELTNDEGFITNAEETDPTVPSYVKEITMADINNWNDKQDELVSGSNIKTINNNSLLGSGDIQITATEYVAGTGIDITGDTISNTITSYQDLTDLPTPITNTSQLVNDSGFITNSVDDLQNYLTTSVIESILPHSSDSGTGPLYLENSANYKLHTTLNPSEIQQHTTDGRNLLPTAKDLWESGHYDASGNKTEYATRMRLIDLLPIESSTTYSVICGTSYFIIREYDENESFINSIGAVYTNGTFTTSATCKYLGIAVEITYSNYEEGNQKIAIFYNSEADKTWEEYTGGMPSPNPLYPQDIHVTTGENSITVTGKNLFDYETFKDNSTATITGTANNFTYSGASKTTNYTSKFEENINYKISGTWSTTYGNGRVRVAYTDGTYQTVFENYSSSSANGTIDITTYGTKQIDYIEITTWTSGNFTINNLQIERGTTVTSYAPYQSQEYPIDLGTTEYLKIGDTADRIYKNVPSDPDYISSPSLIDKWLHRANIFTVWLGDNANFDTVTHATGYYMFENHSPVNIPNPSVANKYGVNEYFKPNTHNSVYIQSGELIIEMSDEIGITTVEDLNTWLITNQPTAYWKGYDSTGMFTEQEQFEALSQAMAYEGGTHITQENDDLPFDIIADTLEKISN